MLEQVKPMQDKKGNATDGTLDQDTAAMQQVRSLLFGAQVKEIQEKMQKQQEHFLQELNNNREDWLAGLKALEKNMKNENAAMQQELQQEQRDRVNVVQDEQRERAELLDAAKAEQDVQREMLKADLSEQLKNLRVEHEEELQALRDGLREQNEDLLRVARELVSSDKSLDKKLANLSDKLIATEKELRELMRAEDTQLSERLEASHQDALNIISTTAKELRFELVSRAALSALFTAGANKLSNDELYDADREDINHIDENNQL
jgi:hypothetical protein